MMKKMNLLFAVVGMLPMVYASAASASFLSPGDIAIVEAQGTGDSFSWVALRDIPAGVSFTWTDEGWLATGGFRGYPTSEQGQNTITAPPEGIAAGTVFTVPVSDGLGNGGESIMFYDGTSDNAPTTNPGTGLIWGINWGNGGWKSDATDKDKSALPSALVGFSTAAPNQPGVIYNGPTSGTQAELVAAIGNPANWTTYTGNTWSGGNFNVVPEPSTLLMLGLGVLGLGLAIRRRRS
jgi:uncharacterized protein